MRIDRSRRTLRVLAVVAAASAALAACSSQGGAANNPPAASGGGAAGGGNGTNYVIQMITHEQAGDTFWDKIRAGAEDAARNTGVTLQYSNNENGPEGVAFYTRAKVVTSRWPHVEAPTGSSFHFPTAT